MNQRTGRSRRAFTLIELMITVAIIAILAAIALPNYLNAQVRAKVARAKADMRTVATGLEQYAVDSNGYPDMFTRIRVITTPVNYLTSMPRDVFRLQQTVNSDRGWRQRWYRYGAMPLDTASRFVLSSVGPDTDIDTYIDANPDNDETDDFEPDNQALRLYPGYSQELVSESGAVVNATTFKYVVYDATNGTISNGDIFRFSDFQGQ